MMAQIRARNNFKKLPNVYSTYLSFNSLPLSIIPNKGKMNANETMWGWGNVKGGKVCQFDSRQSVVVIKDMTGGRGSLARTLVKVLMAAEHATCFH